MGAWRSYLLKPWAKPLVAAFVLSPLFFLIYAALFDERLLGPNPAEALIRDTGELALRYLCVTLAITPLRVVSSTPQLARFRSLMGLVTYTYAVCHVLAYSWLDMGFELADILQDIPKRPFILVGFLAFVLLTPLALTSFNAAIKTLGAKRWQWLHKSVYAIAGLGVLHFFWMRAGKQNFGEVSVYAALLAVLLGWRVWRFLKNRRSGLL